MIMVCHGWSMLIQIDNHGNSKASKVCGPEVIGVDSLYEDFGCIGMQNFGDITCRELTGGESGRERVFCYSETYFLNIHWIWFRAFIICSLTSLQNNLQKLVANYWTLAVKCRRTCCIWGGPLGLKLWRWLCLAAPKAQCRVCHLPLTNIGTGPVL